MMLLNLCIPNFVHYNVACVYRILCDIAQFTWPTYYQMDRVCNFIFIAYALDVIICVRDTHVDEQD